LSFPSTCLRGKKEEKDFAGGGREGGRECSLLLRLDREEKKEGNWEDGERRKFNHYSPLPFLSWRGGKGQRRERGGGKEENSFFSTVHSSIRSRERKKKGGEGKRKKKSAGMANFYSATPCFLKRGEN